MITHNPLHGSQRAGLPHWALASSDNAESTQGIGMANAWRGRPTPNEAPHRVPGDTGGLAPPPQRATPEAPHWKQNVNNAGPFMGTPSYRRCPSTTERSQLPTAGFGTCGRRRSSALTSPGLAGSLFRIVCRTTVNRPFRFFPQMCVKPRKLNVSGFPWPARRRCSGAYGPNSRRRVFSGCSSRQNLATRSRSSARNRPRPPGAETPR